MSAAWLGSLKTWLFILNIVLCLEQKNKFYPKYHLSESRIVNNSKNETGHRAEHCFNPSIVYNAHIHLTPSYPTCLVDNFWSKPTLICTYLCIFACCWSRRKQLHNIPDKHLYHGIQLHQSIKTLLTVINYNQQDWSKNLQSILYQEYFHGLII